MIELNRYKNLQRSDIDAAIKFIQGSLDAKDAPSWIKRFKKEDKNIKIKKNNLFIEGLMVVGNDERDTLMRSLVYDKGSTIAPSRDAGYYSIKKKYLNVSRRNWTDFLNPLPAGGFAESKPPFGEHMSPRLFEDRLRSAQKELERVLGCFEK